jgi:predicted nucleic acid-binding protein
MQLMRAKLTKNHVLSIPMILLELLAGTKSEADYASLRDDLAVLPLLPMDDAMWEAAYRLSFTLKRQGLTVPTVDVTIAAAAIRHDVRLLHHDRHFDLIARHSPLRSQHIS